MRLRPTPGWIMAAALFLGSASALAPSLAAQEDPGVSSSAFWVPDTWALDGSLRWRDKNDDEQFELELDLSSTWTGDVDELNLHLQSTLDWSDSGTDKNEQLGRLRWFRQLTPRWFIMANGSFERGAVDIGVPELDPLDLVLLGATGGLGIRQPWGETGATRVAVQWNEYYLELLDYRDGEGARSRSLFIDTKLSLGTRTTFSHWATVLFWEDGTRGADSEAELSFKLTDHFGLGFRHRLRDNVASLDQAREHELKIFTRLSF